MQKKKCFPDLCGCGQMMSEMIIYKFTGWDLLTVVKLELLQQRFMARSKILKPSTSYISPYFYIRGFQRHF